jgi:glycosyltransferase involved in cell wall biosynthesis
MSAMSGDPFDARQERLGRQAIAPLGVSVVVCCYNSASRLPRVFEQTLAHLAIQQTRDEIPWELIVVDNASTDDTVQFAQRCWPAEHPISAHIVHEPRLGLSYARERGLNEATYKFVSFVDDDNWVCSDWIERVVSVMLEHPEAGAVGGFSEPSCEVTPPWWLHRVGMWIALGPDIDGPSDVTESLEILCGAGMTVRKTAWVDLRHNGFRFQLSDRKGEALSGCGDTELCLALRLAGWRLWYDPQLRFRHFMPANRLNWQYIRRLVRTTGASTATLDPYYIVLEKLGRRPLSAARRTPRALRATLLFEIIYTVRSMIYHYLTLIRGSFSTWEGQPAALELEYYLGRLPKLLAMCGTFQPAVRRVRRASWVQSPVQGVSAAVKIHHGSEKP